VFHLAELDRENEKEGKAGATVTDNSKDATAATVDVVDARAIVGGIAKFALAFALRIAPAVTGAMTGAVTYNRTVGAVIT
jgi:hypothetical protein